MILDYLLEMFKYVEPIYMFHVGFLKEVEQRLAMWYVVLWDSILSHPGGYGQVILNYLLEMFKYVEPIYMFHVGFLKEVEQRLAMWNVVLGNSILSRSGGGGQVILEYLLEMFKYVEPIYKFHVGFFKEVEQRLSMWYV